MAELNRRDFLKIIGLTGATAAMGCSSESGRTLVPYVLPPEEIIPGEATWYASTCRECPAGCGIVVKNRDGRVIKVEGDPLHPINQGKLCARGQASVQGLYNPDRIRGPLKRTAQGRFEPITWTEAEKLLGQRVREITDKRKGERIAFITNPINGSARVQEQSDGRLFHTITFGLDRHPSLGFMLTEADRWAIIYYIRSLKKV